MKPYIWASLVAQTVKCLPAMQETWVQSPGREDPLEREMATHSSTFAWKTPWMEEPGRLQSMGLQRVGHDWETSLLAAFTSPPENDLCFLRLFKEWGDHRRSWEFGNLSKMVMECWHSTELHQCLASLAPLPHLTPTFPSTLSPARDH